MGVSNIARLKSNHDDLQGIIGTPQNSGALGSLDIRDTGFQILAFENTNDDVLYMTFQMSHRKKLGTAIDSVHIHYYLPSAPSAGQTCLFNTEWTWFNDGLSSEVVPATADWTKATGTALTFTGTEAAYSTGIFSVLTNLAAPTNEIYSSILLVKITRDSSGDGSDTYNDDLGLLFCDAHYVTDRTGSANESTD